MNSRCIPDWEIIFHPSSLVDTTGRLFWYKEGLYRGIILSTQSHYLLINAANRVHL